MQLVLIASFYSALAKDVLHKHIYSADATMMWMYLLSCRLTRNASTHYKLYFCTARTSCFVMQSLLLVQLYSALVKNVLRNIYLESNSPLYRQK